MRASTPQAHTKAEAPTCSILVPQVSARSIHSRFGTQKELQHKAKMCNAPSFDLLMHWRHSLTKTKHKPMKFQSCVPSSNWGCCAKPASVVKSKVWYSGSLFLSRLTPVNPACRQHTELWVSPSEQGRHQMCGSLFHTVSLSLSHICIYTHTFPQFKTHIEIRTFWSTYLSIYLFLYIYICTYVYIYMYIYIYINISVTKKKKYIYIKYKYVYIACVHACMHAQ